MEVSGPYFLVMLLPPLLTAFAVQLLLSRDQRHRLRRWVAALWVALIAVMTTWEPEQGAALGIALFALLLVGLSFLVAYCGAFAGSHGALLLMRRGRRP